MAQVAQFNFQQFRDVIKLAISSSVRNNVENIVAEYKSTPGSDSEKKPTVDQAFKDVLKSLVEDQKSTDDHIALIYLAVLAVEQELCSASVPFVMLSEVLDTITIDECEKVFEFVEDRVDTWKSDTFYNAGKNYLLRMCNDLLRRLSRSQHIIFCGRIQLFLARLFPLTEKSGLNLMSQFNLENVTEFTTKVEDFDKGRKSTELERDEAMEEGEMAETPNSITIDYNLYKKFWELQDFFRKPAQCYDGDAWKKFSNYSDEVLACFESFKLDEIKSSKRSREMQKKASKSQSFFAKYLTSEKLLDLQLSDSNFRRFVLVQFLILFQYLNAQVKFKSSSHILVDDQSSWVRQASSRVFQILRETPPDGAKFAAAIEHILAREENWNTWKNEGCPSYVRERPKDTVKMPQRPHKRSIGDDLKASGGKIIKMGSAELTRLWNLNPDNLAACRDQSRNFIPNPEVFFEEAVDQLDPEAMVEDEYKLVNKSTFAWKSLRLLARRSCVLFALAPPGQQPGTKQSMAEYLSETLTKNYLVKETNGGSEEKTVESAESVEEEKTDMEERQDATLEDKQSDPTPAPSPPSQEPMVTKDQCVQLAEAVGADWKKLATELNFADDEVDYFEQSATQVAEGEEPKPPHTAATNMLELWMENEREKATVSALQHALKEVGLVEVSVKVLGAETDS